MVRSRTLLAVVLGLGMAGAMASPAFAQQGGGPGGGGPGGQRWDPQQMRERMEQRMKESLGVTDDEWKVLQPKVEKVQQLQMQSRGGMFGGMGGGRRGGPGGGQGGGDANAPQSPVANASRELRETLDNKDSTPDQIKVKLQALRDVRVKAREELTTAQAELKELLTARQEAALVAQGMLE